MEAQQMATTKLSDEEFLAFLEKHPDLRDRFASIVSAVENSEGNLKEADAAEERIIEEMRLLGREAMQGWAKRQVEVTEREIRQQPSKRAELSRFFLKPRGAQRRFTRARSRAASKLLDASFSDARFAPASARIPAFMRSGTERHGSWAKWRSNLARKAAT